MEEFMTNEGFPIKRTIEDLIVVEDDNNSV